ncbi:hypothetical protein [Corynebacterium sp. AOP12-C2-36]|uniref:hypothetical protein n=1 Tax=Corynebacterium sp. AOP12-C2-36 TaxID=3457723 RepID=UPI004033AD73
MIAADLHPAEAAYYASIRAGAPWATAAEAAMKHLADAGRPFSCDDLRELLADCGDPPTPNAFGGLFISWSKQGLIQKVGGGSSRALKRHGGHRHLWRGTNHPPS